MEIHHHSHPSASLPAGQAGSHRKKWTHYIWEFLMLFLAVTLGFFVENQREHIVEHNKARDYARTLIQDLSSDTTTMTKWKQYLILYNSLMDSMILMTINKKINHSSSGKFAWYCRHALWHNPLPWQRTTLEQLKSSGNIRYFKDYRLQEMISKYYMETEGVINFFTLENPSSDKARDMANKILDVETNYLYSKISLQALDSIPVSFIDSLTNRDVSLTNKDDLVNEIANMAIYRKRNFIPIIQQLPELITKATELIVELKKKYHLE